MHLGSAIIGSRARTSRSPLITVQSLISLSSDLLCCHLSSPTWPGLLHLWTNERLILEGATPKVVVLAQGGHLSSLGPTARAATVCLRSRSVTETLFDTRQLKLRASSTGGLPCRQRHVGPFAFVCSTVAPRVATGALSLQLSSPVEPGTRARAWRVEACPRGPGIRAFLCPLCLFVCPFIAPSIYHRQHRHRWCHLTSAIKNC